MQWNEAKRVFVCLVMMIRGFPLWLHFIPGIKFRTDNEPFKSEMQRFTTKVVDTMKGAGLYASQGGPIILSQVCCPVLGVLLLPSVPCRAVCGGRVRVLVLT
jgi:hypothetical protein